MRFLEIFNDGLKPFSKYDQNSLVELLRKRPITKPKYEKWGPLVYELLDKIFIDETNRIKIDDVAKMLLNIIQKYDQKENFIN